MRIGEFIRRLLGFGGSDSPCALCRCAIPASDFHKGRAVIIARQSYCKGCVEEITHRGGLGLGLAADTGSSSHVLR